MAKIALLAGGGALPEIVASSCRHQGRDLLIIGFNGFTDPILLKKYPSQLVRLGQIGKVLALLKKNKIDQIVFAGHVTRPAFSQIRPDWQGLKLLWTLRKKRMGDDGLLRTLSGFFEKHGVQLIGADQLVPDSIMPHGILTTQKPSAEELKDIAYGQKILKTWGDLDQGQAIVIQQGLVLGVEAIEGTDELIKRCSAYKRPGSKPILIKTKKPKQDRRLDLPTIGENTIKNAIAAGYAGIAVQAGDALFLQPSICVEQADQNGLFIIGIDPIA